MRRENGSSPHFYRLEAKDIAIMNLANDGFQEICVDCSQESIYNDVVLRQDLTR